ncbi:MULTISPECIES: hypothetical protein [unclassified Akkermansia]|uniref:hypothetical protein n=1 Tax=unclassified Akkermansia TaxID=2608915 RepID=UPI0008304B11|nr:MULTISPECIES: hypothetical protein [unclassified Akkermansia]
MVLEKVDTRGQGCAGDRKEQGEQYSAESARQMNFHIIWQIMSYRRSRKEKQEGAKAVRREAHGGMKTPQED